MTLGRQPRAAFVSAGVGVLLALLLILLLPTQRAQAQYPPPTPSPTSTTIEGELECEVETGPDFIIIRCTGGGFAAGAAVLAQVYGVGCGAPTAAVADGINAAPLPGERLLLETTLTADENGDVRFEGQIDCCDASALRIVLTGPTADGDTLVLEDVIDDPAVLACASGALATTGVDWLRWLAVGLWLLTAGVWIANVRDERAHAPAH